MDICHFVCKTFNIDVKIEELSSEVYTAGTQFAVSVLVYPLVMAIVIHFYLPVYDQLRLTTSYQYLQLRNQDTSTFRIIVIGFSANFCPDLLSTFVSFCQHAFPKCNLNRNASE